MEDNAASFTTSLDLAKQHMDTAIAKGEVAGVSQDTLASIKDVHSKINVRPVCLRGCMCVRACVCVGVSVCVRVWV